jgi:hypothetical protein
MRTLFFATGLAMALSESLDSYFEHKSFSTFLSLSDRMPLKFRCLLALLVLGFLSEEQILVLTFSQAFSQPLFSSSVNRLHCQAFSHYALDLAREPPKLLELGGFQVRLLLLPGRLLCVKLLHIGSAVLISSQTLPLGACSISTYCHFLQTCLHFVKTKILKRGTV